MTHIPSLSWNDFVRRLRRTQAPTSVQQLLPRAAGGQVVVRSREVEILEATSSDSPKIAVRITNAGSIATNLSIGVRDAQGRKVGRTLPHGTPRLAAGSTATVEVQPTKKQLEALREGGVILVGPGNLPPEQRSIQVRFSPDLNVQTWTWDVPAPYKASFAPPEGSGRLAARGERGHPGFSALSRGSGHSHCQCAT